MFIRSEYLKISFIPAIIFGSHVFVKSPIYFPVALVLGLLFGLVIASLMEVAARLHIFPSLPDTSRPINWIKMLKIAVSIFLILVLIGALTGIV